MTQNHRRDKQNKRKNEKQTIPQKDHIPRGRFHTMWKRFPNT